MYGDFPPASPGRTVQCLGLGRIRHTLIQSVLDHKLCLFRSDRTQDQDAGSNPGLAESDRFLWYGHTEPRGSSGQGRPGDLNSPVAVGIGLHHRHHLGSRSGQSARKEDVRLDGIEINLGPSWPHRLSLLDQD
jgi:hypothetical protein